MARQKLFTKAVERELSKYPLYSQDGKGDNAKVVVKFFHPYSNRTWYRSTAGLTHVARMVKTCEKFASFQENTYLYAKLLKVLSYEKNS